ncbi:hypothetical protein HBH56_096840 [Parastagonospora nodorum]|uniref:RRM domain-containing protein n=1 Tax=Phaeosphaeria nodorum (strain SN15 / ATCC MYA-4574 / FGSC 10173) TaxID=321614 RepID=A0A7U2NR32_PHANO|nr:hypothetical protein HBH56_096840 [Parastagonospora nodorum]QRD07273.1 hypothetical protein JI435_447150 [Parastagonospora nodorum SN15]KAH3930388.1 hypothetical protein HBH54_111160 [Parastagonospora nodorum]KAH3967021.1 hypothetical protein HBH51_139680 [Parastagonospora nodorum]KAH4026897.1 hypothetical protein HBI09_145510 [Parastagonospora nodorum]
MFTTEEDVRQLFVEPGFQQESILVSYDAEIGLAHTTRKLVVLLRSPEQVPQAIKDLDGAIMFDSRLGVVPHHKTPNPGYVEYYWGWFAVSDPSLFKQRAPILKILTDISGTPIRMEGNYFLTKFSGFRTAARRMSPHIRTRSLSRKEVISSLSQLYLSHALQVRC